MFTDPMHLYHSSSLLLLFGNFTSWDRQGQLGVCQHMACSLEIDFVVMGDELWNVFFHIVNF